MKLKFLLIATLNFAATSSAFAMCFGAYQVNVQANQVAIYADQLTTSLQFSAMHRLRQSSIQLANSARFLANNSFESSINCNYTIGNYNILSNYFADVSALIPYTQNQNARANYQYLATQMNVLSQFVSNLVSSTPRVVRYPRNPRRVIVPVPVPRRHTPAPRRGAPTPRHRNHRR